MFVVAVADSKVNCVNGGIGFVTLSLKQRSDDFMLSDAVFD